MDSNLTVNEQIRRLDEEAEDSAILASDLVEEQKNETNKKSEATAQEGAESESQAEHQPKNFASFSIVDENGQPLGSNDQDPAVNATANTLRLRPFRPVVKEALRHREEIETKRRRNANGAWIRQSSSKCWTCLSADPRPTNHSSRQSWMGHPGSVAFQ